MVILITSISIALVALIWTSLTPIIICLDTNQPSGLLHLELKGVFKYQIHIENDKIFGHLHTPLFKSSKEFFKKHDRRTRVKKKVKKKQKSGHSNCLKPWFGQF